jgi:hypothetical protein
MNTGGDPIMNDDTLITAVREPFTGVHMNIPVEQIVSRGRAVRARRRIPGMAGALAVAAGAALAVTALLPAGHQPGIGWRPGQWPGRLMARSMSPSASCATRSACSASSARTAFRPASPSSASRTRRAGTIPRRAPA